MAFNSPLPTTNPNLRMSEMLLSETPAAANASGYGIGGCTGAGSGEESGGGNQRDD